MAQTATEAEQENQAMRKMTFGEKAVGLTFNPSGDEKVAKLKKLYAEAIDIVIEGHQDVSAFEGDLNQGAVYQTVLAQMAAVKAVTWKK